MRVSAAAAAIAIGCCAVALATQREVTDVRPALLEAFTVDSRATAQYSQLVKSRADSDTVTRAIQEEILPAFSRERAKLDALGRVPAEQDGDSRRTCAGICCFARRTGDSEPPRQAAPTKQHCGSSKPPTDATRAP